MAKVVKQIKCKNKGCDNYFTPFKSTDKYCSRKCFNDNLKPNLKLKDFKPIKKVSDKRKIEMLKYSVLRTEFLGKPENQKCPITGKPTTDIHHTYCGKDRAKYYLDVSTWLAVSRDGHNWIHNNPKEARELGFLK